MENAAVADLDVLFVAARAGSREALGRLLESFRPYLQFRAQSELGIDLNAKLGASDLLQETMTAAFQAFPQFRGATEHELLAWLQSILAHQAANLANHFRGTDKRRIDREQSLDDSALGRPLRERLEIGGATPSEIFVKREEANALECALARLREDYRRVIELHHRDGMGFQEMATMIGRSEGAVRKLWARALEAWQDEVERSYGRP